MQRPPSTFPLSDVLLFVAASVAILAGYSWWVAHNPPPRQPQQAAQQEKEKAAPAEKKAEGVPPAAGAEGGQAGAPKPAEPAKAAAKIAPRPPQPSQVLTLGSADPDAKNRYRMLATFSNRGAAPVRIELSSPRYHDLDDRGGYSRAPGHRRGSQRRQLSGAGRRRRDSGGRGRPEAGRPDPPSRRHNGPQRRRSRAGAGENQTPRQGQAGRPPP